MSDSKNKIVFLSVRDGYTISVEVPWDSNLEACIEAFRAFLLAIGYHPESVAKHLDNGVSG